MRLLKEWRARGDEKRVVVGEEEILHVVSKWTGIPLQRMGQGEMQRLLTVEVEMEKVVVGQREAVGALCKALKRFARGFKRSAPAYWHVLCCSARRVWAKRCWPRRSPSRCSATRNRSFNWT